MYDIDRIDSQEHSVTATVCENAQLFGATPERGEFDPREVWDRDHTLHAAGEPMSGVASPADSVSDGFQSLRHKRKLQSRAEKVIKRKPVR